MAKEHQFLFNLKKNDLAIVRHYAANMIDYIFLKKYSYYKNIIQ